MDTITKTIKREWPAKIVDRSKRIAYRQIRRTWTNRLKKLQMPFRLVLRNGMCPPIAGVTVRIDRIVPNPRTRDGNRRVIMHYTLVECSK